LSIPGSTTVTYGSDLTCSIYPDEGFRVTDVTVDGVSMGAVPEYVFRNITADHEIAVEFELRTYTINAICGTGGSISQPGSAVLDGDDQTISIVPDSGYRIEDVVVDGISSGKVSEYIFENVTSDHTISVLFRRIYTITASAGRGGSVSPSGTILVPEDSVLSVRIVPDNGYRILNVLLDNQSLQDIDEYTFPGVKSDHDISAFFTDQVGISVFPNPFREHFKLNIKSPSDFSFKVYVLTLTNKVIYRNDNITGSTSAEIFLDVDPGIYILKVYKENSGILTLKLIRRLGKNKGTLQVNPHPFAGLFQPFHLCRSVQYLYRILPREKLCHDC